MNEQRAQINVTPLTDPQQCRSAAAGMLSRHQSDPRRHLPPVGEAPCVSDGGHQCAGAQGSDTRDLLKLLAELTAAMPCLDLRFELADLAIELLEVVQQSLHQMPERCRQLVSGILEDLWHALSHSRDALGHHHAELAEQAPDLVGLRSARLNEALPHTVERQYGLLFDTFDWHEAHVRSGDRLTDRLGIGDIVLVRFHIGLDELWGHQSHRMSKPLELSGPVMRTAAGFHPNQARRQLREERRHLVAFELLLQHRPATLINPMHLEHILCKVNANRRNLHRGRSPRFKWLISTSTLAH